MDQTAPLPRLGLGLAIIRDGDLKDGRQQIEIAAGLDPNNSLIRSYLGKAFYDEKRDSLADSQLEIAKSLDPLDPTPWYYDAIRKQSINRPVEALHDLQKSVALNNNRAVYRSKLMLDDDLAARSASLGRIYNDLGFGQLALVEGWKSLQSSPSNYSAHRFLADVYAALPRHEIARVSELLQSQLLQPLNSTPVQPRLAESNLFTLEGAGPSDLAFNEFNPLFTRNRVTLQASGVAGSNETLGDEVVFSGLKDNFSFSLGQFHHETDGFRENNDLNQNIYNVFGQASLTPKTSIQAEYRYYDGDKGDMKLRFDPDNFSSTLRNDDRTSTLRLGLRHAFAPRSDLIASAIMQTSKFNAQESTLDVTVDVESYIAEAAYLFDSERYGFTIGGGYYTAVSEEDLTLAFPFGPQTTNHNFDDHHSNIYGYGRINFPDDLFWTIGLSYDDFEEVREMVGNSQLNPKFGLVWKLLPETTLRAAAFRVLKRTVIANQTLEPTQVAGFNQFYDDSNAAESWRYGIGVDQKVTGNLYVGLEYTQRDMEIPYPDVPPPPAPPESFIDYADWQEKLSRAYIYWTPHAYWAIGGEFFHEDLERDQKFTGDEALSEIKTYRIPVNIGFFHPSGVSTRLIGTYIDQKGEFGNRFMGFEEDDDQFWIFDAAIGYRLPKRYGLISIEAKNLFDTRFNYQNTDTAAGKIYPEFTIFAKLTLSF